METIVEIVKSIAKVIQMPEFWAVVAVLGPVLVNYFPKLKAAGQVKLKTAEGKTPEEIAHEVKLTLDTVRKIADAFNSVKKK